MSVAGNSYVVSTGCSAVSVTHPVPWQMVGLNSTVLEEYSCLYQRDGFWSNGKEIFLFHNIWLYKEEIFLCSLRKSACCSRKKEKKNWALSPSTCKSSETITHHPLLLNLWPTLCPSVWPKRTQMEAHSVLAAPHKCAEMLSSSRATQRAEPSTVGAMLSYSNTETTLQLSPRGSACRLMEICLYIPSHWSPCSSCNLPPPCVWVQQQKTCFSGVCAAAGVVNQADDRHLL